MANIVCPHCTAINRVPSDKPAAKAKCGACHEPLFSGKPVDASAASFGTHIGRNDIPVVVDFWAEWCGPCKMIAPILSEIATEQSGKVTIAKLNVDENPDLAMRFNVMSIPTLLVFRNGEVAKRLVGAKGKGQLLQELDEFLPTSL